MTENADQADFWSGPSGQSWVTHEAQQDRLLAPVADIITARVGLASGDRVVDIGCGAGALSVICAETVGEDGRVLATDISEPLLTRAKERLGPFPQADTLLADAQNADWAERDFEHAVSRFGVMFFADPAAAFANIARALRPGGRMTFASWAPASENPYWSGVAQIATARLGQPPRVEQDTPGPMGLADVDLTVQRFRAAGLKDVLCEPVDLHLTFDGSPEDFARLLTVLGPAARIVNHFEATGDQVQAVRDDLANWLGQFQADGGIRLPARINMIEAVTP